MAKELVIEDIYEDADIERLDPPVREGMSNWSQYLRVSVENNGHGQEKWVEGPNLILQGSSGQGKTYALHALRNGMAKLWLNGSPFLPRIVHALTIIENTGPYSPKREESFEKYQKNCLLMIDGLGDFPESAEMQKRFYKVLNFRREHGFATCVATNCSANQLESKVGKAVYEVLEPGAHTVMFPSCIPNRREQEHDFLPNAEMLDIAEMARAFSSKAFKVDA